MTWNAILPVGSNQEFKGALSRNIAQALCNSHTTAASSVECSNKDESFLKWKRALDEHFKCAYIVQVETSTFNDGETFVAVGRLKQNVPSVIFHTVERPFNDNIMQLLLTIDAVKRSSTGPIHLVVPYIPYSRQDCRAGPPKDRSTPEALHFYTIGLPLSAKVIAKLLSQDVKNILSMDCHSRQSEGFYDVPLHNVGSHWIFNFYIDNFCKEKNIDKNNIAIVAADAGSVRRAREIAHLVGEVALIVIDKYREKAGVSQVMTVIGNAQDKHCFIVDDIIDSGGTLMNAASALKEKGAKSVYACITHAVLGKEPKETLQKVEDSVLDRLVITNTIDWDFDLRQYRKIAVLDISSDVLINCAHYMRDLFDISEIERK